MRFLSKDAAKLTVPYASDLFVGEDTVLVEVGETPGLLNKERRKTVSIRLIVLQLGAHVVENLELKSLKKNSRYIIFCSHGDVRSTVKR